MNITSPQHWSGTIISRSDEPSSRGEDPLGIQHRPEAVALALQEHLNELPEGTGDLQRSLATTCFQAGWSASDGTKITPDDPEALQAALINTVRTNVEAYLRDIGPTDDPQQTALQANHLARAAFMAAVRSERFITALEEKYGRPSSTFLPAEREDLPRHGMVEIVTDMMSDGKRGWSD